MVIRNFKSRIILSFNTLETLRSRVSWYINLRWLAIFAILVSIPIAQRLLYLELPYKYIVLIASILLAINLVYFLLCRHLPYSDEVQELIFAEMQIVIDLIILSFLIHYSGGISNPFFFLYIVQVILSGILFPGVILPYLNAFIAAFLLSMWSFFEYFGLVNTYPLSNVTQSLSYLAVALAAFYFINFAGIYIINNFMISYRTLKKIIDEKSDMLEKVMTDRSKAFRYAAHELKAPLTAIKSTLEVVKDLYRKDLNREVLDMILRSERRADQVLSMVKELIAITQYNLGLEKPNYKTVDFNNWLYQAVLLHKSNAINKNIELSFIDLIQPYKVELDRIGMDKVASNLISNAIVYTSKGGKVIIEPFIESDRFGFVVSDTGIGISEDEIDKIFDEFYRGKNAREVERIGTGLGLNLVKEILKTYGGLIKVKSILNKGSKFIVELPLNVNESLLPKLKESTKFYLFE